MKKTESELLHDHWDADNIESDPAIIEKVVRYEVDRPKAVARIIFDHPERMNALPIVALERVGDLIREAEMDDDVKVIILKGEGPCFGTGADARELGHYIGYGKGTDKATKARPPQRKRILPDRNLVYGAFQKPLEQCLKATICQVHSYCYGGHFQLALAADIVIASPDAVFTHPAFRYLGAAPQDMYLWMENLGLKKMKEIILTMRPLSAEEGERAGFVNKVVPLEDLEQWTEDYAQAIRMMPLDGIMMGKAMMLMMMEARGKSLGSMIQWVGHGWATNLSLDSGDWNFLKERRDKGLAQALRERDQMVAPYFRLGGRGPKGASKNGAKK